MSYTNKASRESTLRKAPAQLLVPFKFFSLNQFLWEHRLCWRRLAPRAAAQAAPHGPYGLPVPFVALYIWIREPHRYVLYMLYRTVPQIHRYVYAH